MKTNLQSKIVVASLTVILNLCLFQTGWADSKSVTVDNTAANPVPVNVQNQVPVNVQNTVNTNASDNPAFGPFESVQDVITNGLTGLVGIDVPAGKRLVIEFVSVEGKVPTGQHVFAAYVNQHRLTLSAQGPNCCGQDSFSASQQLRLYAGPGNDAVQISVTRDQDPGTAEFHFTVSGYLVNLP